MDVQKTKVILVGNSTFLQWGGENKAIPNVEQNMELLKNIFVDPNFFGIPNDPQHLVVIKNEASQDILLKVKHETKSFVGKDNYDRLIFYYSGHGIPGEDAKLFLASSDTIRSDYEITSVSTNRLFSYLKAFCAKELIIILDCCYAAQSVENQGDADSLISKSLPEKITDLQVNENGIYFLFAAGRDNVAKFNPLDSSKPTYFTEALLNTIGTGTIPGNDFVTMGEVYVQLCREIAELKKTSDADIPDPRPVLQGNVNDFVFCKNIKYKNKEDQDFEDVQKNPTWDNCGKFKKKYSDPKTNTRSRFDDEIDALLSKINKGEIALRTLREKKDIDLAIQIKKDYKSIPYIWDEAERFINDLAAKPIQETIAMESATFNDNSLIKDVSNATLVDSAAGPSVIESEANPADSSSFNTKFSSTARA